MKRAAMLFAVVLCLCAWAASDATVAPRAIANRKSTIVKGVDAITIPQMISYQGKLTDTFGLPVADTLYAVRFRLYVQPTGGTQFWEENQQARTRGGLFSTLLGSVTPIGSVPDAGAVYLGMAVAGGAEMTPRLRIASAAYAYLSERAANSDLLQGKDTTAFDSRYVNEGQASSVTSNMIVDGTIAAADLNQMGAASGQVMKWTGSAWAPRNDSVGAGGGDNAWVRGTPDSVLYTVHPLGIARSGSTLYGNTAFSHVNLGTASFTGASGYNFSYCTVGGGNGNKAPNAFATVGGGQNNTALAEGSTVAGGDSNCAAGHNSTISGGAMDTATYTYGTVSGGHQNVAAGFAATVSGGEVNAAGEFAAVGGGQYNNARSAPYASIGGGYGNNAGDTLSVIGGGMSNRVTGSYAVAGGGAYNLSSGRYASVGGGYSDTASGVNATIGGGYGNNAGDMYATVAGGYDNTASGYAATVGGGTGNTASGIRAVVGGGLLNLATNSHATVGGGYGNNASGDYTTVAGGNGNVAASTYSMVGGGSGDTAYGYCSSVAGHSVRTRGTAYYTFAFGEDCSTSTERAVVFYHSGAPTKLGVGVQNPVWNMDVSGKGKFTGKLQAAAGFKADTSVADSQWATKGYVDTHSGGDNAWVRGTPDSVLYTIRRLGIAKGGAGNVLYGESAYTHVNLGVACTTGTTGQRYSYCTVSGGRGNSAWTNGTTVGGGWGNKAASEYATAVGGYGNNASHPYTTVGGGNQNTASSYTSTVGGGYGNTASGYSATISGGEQNTATSSYASVGGGLYDTSDAYASFTTNSYSAVPSGFDNSAAFNGQRATSSNQTRVGALSKASGTFTIDHPTDPSGKILNHYFIEGPEMLNIYRGSAVLDGSGRAVVTLPDYFDALNRNPMVQLTGVGGPDVVYVAEKVQDNRFVIGGKPGMEVYWTVTGERKDVSAEITRRLMPVEQPKTGVLAGTMLDDDFLRGAMDQLVREGKTQGIDFRTAAGRQRYEKMKQSTEHR